MNLCRCFRLTKRLTQIGKESVDLLHCAAVPLDFACPAVGFRVGDQLDLSLAARAQAWCVLSRRTELRTGQVQVTLTWSLLRQAQTVAQLQFGLEEIAFQPIDGVGRQRA